MCLFSKNSKRGRPHATPGEPLTPWSPTGQLCALDAALGDASILSRCYSCADSWQSPPVCCQCVQCHRDLGTHCHLPSCPNVSPPAISPSDVSHVAWKSVFLQVRKQTFTERIPTPGVKRGPGNWAHSSADTAPRSGHLLSRTLPGPSPGTRRPHGRLLPAGCTEAGMQPCPRQV